MVRLGERATAHLERAGGGSVQGRLAWRDSEPGASRVAAQLKPRKHTSRHPNAASLPNEAMTAQILSGELANLVNESKRKNPDLRNVRLLPAALTCLHPRLTRASLRRRQTSLCRSCGPCPPPPRPS